MSIYDVWSPGPVDHPGRRPCRLLASGEAIVEPGHYLRRLAVDGVQRFYEIDVGAKVDLRRMVRAVMLLHGGGGFPAAMRQLTQFERIEDVVAIYPAGWGPDEYGGWWNTGNQAGETKENDVRFLAAVYQDARARFRFGFRGGLPYGEWFVAGHSNGGQMALLLGDAGKVGAVASVGGPRLPNVMRRPVLFAHGTADAFVPYRAAKAIWSQWPLHNRAGSWWWPGRSVVGSAELWNYNRGANPVRCWTLHDGGHSWPGGGELPGLDLGPINRDLDFSAECIRFFEGFGL